jgi:hypothetical protein
VGTPPYWTNRCVDSVIALLAASHSITLERKGDREPEKTRGVYQEDIASMNDLLVPKE